MNIKQVRQKIIKTDWYYQGGAAKPWYHSFPWSACFDMRLFEKKIPLKYDVLVFLQNSFFDVYVSKKSLTEVAKYYFKKQTRDSSFIYKLYKSWKKLVKEYLKINNQILKQDLAKLNDEQFLDLFKKFSSAYVKEWQEIIFLDGFDFYGDYILNKALSKISDLTADEIGILTAPPCPSFLQQERLELLGLAEHVLQRKIKLSKKIPTAILPKLESISKKYYWLLNDYATAEYLGPGYFYKKLRHLVANKKTLAEEREMKKFLSGLGKEKRKIVARKKLAHRFTNTINFLAFLGNMRDERKTYNQMAGNTIKKLGQEAARRTRTPFREVEHLFYYEVPKIFTADKKIRKTLKQRMGGAFYIPLSPVKNTEIYGDESIELGRSIKSIIFSDKVKLEGRPAFAGVVKGRAKIVKDKGDFRKMKKGDILVAPNTRPEYVPIMKLASAIVTDEGGITSHAAIVSRELKVPCVVGVQGATTILKDGQIIEVDAHKGTVRIINK